MVRFHGHGSVERISKNIAICLVYGPHFPLIHDWWKRKFSFLLLNQILTFLFLLENSLHMSAQLFVLVQDMLQILLRKCLYIQKSTQLNTTNNRHFCTNKLNRFKVPAFQVDKYTTKLRVIETRQIFTDFCEFYTPED